MRVFIIFLLIFLSLSGFSQIEIDRNDNYLLSDTTPKNNLLNLGTNFHLNSNSINNDFTKGLLYGGFIDNERKDLVSEKLKDHNRFGFEFNGGLNYYHKLKNDLTIVTGLNERQLLDAGFTRDLFELVFKGNSQYAGKNADLSKTRIQYFDYQKLYLGLQKKINEKIIVGGGINIIRGGKFNELKIDKGNLYTETDGQYLDFDMKFRLAFTEGGNAFSSHGFGAGANLNFSLLQAKGRLNFEMRDLGFISWKDVNVYEGDSTFRYEGQKVNDILNFNDSIFTQIKADSIAADFGINKKLQNINYFIPATFHLNYVYPFSQKLTLVTGVKYMIRSSYIPRVYLKGLYYFRPDFFIAPLIGYGGFGKLDIEIGAAKSFKQTFIVSANIFYLEYFIIPKKSAGHGINFSLTKLF